MPLHPHLRCFFILDVQHIVLAENYLEWGQPASARLPVCLTNVAASVSDARARFRPHACLGRSLSARSQRFLKAQGLVSAGVRQGRPEPKVAAGRRLGQPRCAPQRAGETASCPGGSRRASQGSRRHRSLLRARALPAAPLAPRSTSCNGSPTPPPLPFTPPPPPTMRRWPHARRSIAACPARSRSCSGSARPGCRALASASASIRLSSPAMPCRRPSLSFGSVDRDASIDLHGHVLHDTTGRTGGHLGLRYHGRVHGRQVTLGLQGAIENDWLQDVERYTLGAELRLGQLEVRASVFDDVPQHPATRQIAERRLDGYQIAIDARIPYLPWASLEVDRFWQMAANGETATTRDRLSLRLTPLAPLEIEDRHPARGRASILRSRSCAGGSCSTADRLGDRVNRPTPSARADGRTPRHAPPACSSAARPASAVRRGRRPTARVCRHRRSPRRTRTARPRRPAPRSG